MVLCLINQNQLLAQMGGFIAFPFLMETANATVGKRVKTLGNAQGSRKLQYLHHEEDTQLSRCHYLAVS